MNVRRPLTITGALLTAAAAAGLATAKGVAVTDRRRTGITRRQALVAAGLTDPSDARQHTLVLADGTSLHVVERGPVDGTPLVLLHGVTLSTRIWHRTFDDLGDRFRVIALDWRGHGTSTVGRQGYGLPVLADDLAEVLDRLDLRGALVVGHSMGGMALMQFCGDHRDVLDERVAGLVFLSTASCNVAGGSLPGFVRSMVEHVIRLPGVAGRSSWTAPGDLGYAMVRFTFGERPSPTWVEQIRHITSHTDPESAAQSVVALLSHDAREMLPHVTTPSVVVAGTKDRLTPPSAARLTASLLPDAELVILPGAGHLVMLERQEAFQKLLVQLADRVTVNG
jgi:pimeloyl-ACP methyl ester carboxylesterase